MGSRVMGLIIGCLIFVVILSKGGEAANVYKVGDSLGWEVPPNTTFYTEWATDKTFVVGDSLSFNWSGTHDVAEATKTQYDNCEKSSTVKFSSSGVVLLTTVGSHYFLCTVGSHCTSGQKLAINVTVSNSTTPSTPSTPSPPPPPSSVSTHVSVNSLFATTSTLFVYFMASF